MVQALIEIDDETNKILNLVKVKQGLKDKGQAIEYIVRRYNGEVSEPELIYQNDGDKWMLAEDIPDIDFFFCQIWLSCFVNDIDKIVGRGYNKILGVWEKYHLNFYFGEKDSFDMAETIVRKFDNDPGFALKINEEIVKKSDDLRAYTERISEKELDHLSNEELWKIYEKHDSLHTIYYEWGWVPVSVDMFHNNLTNKLKHVLKEKGLSDESVNENFLILTQPTKKSLIQIEMEEFLRLAEIVIKDKKQKLLFENLYKNFNEQDVSKFGYKTHTKEYEELLEKKASLIVSEISVDILKKIKEHYQKYFYVNHMWVGKAYTLEHYLKELAKLIGTHADVGKSLREIESEVESNNEKRRNVLVELNLEKKWVNLFDAFGDFMVTKIYRRFAQIYAVYKMEFVQNEIAKRFGLSLMQVRFMLPQEVKKALINGYVDKNELEERTKFCVYYAEKGKDIVYTGVKARQLAEQAKKIENKEVNEIKGQTACMGKATGKVRIIIRPSDMHKMNKGDILVSIATDPDIVSAMKKAAAIVTEQGGVTSHAAIVSRELNIPCVIGTKIATKVLKDGDLVEVDASKGIVKILKRA